LQTCHVIAIRTGKKKVHKGKEREQGNNKPPLSKRANSHQVSLTAALRKTKKGTYPKSPHQNVADFGQLLPPPPPGPPPLTLLSLSRRYSSYSRSRRARSRVKSNLRGACAVPGVLRLLPAPTPIRPCCQSLTRVELLALW
jgi:hypothetical protein